MTGSPPPPTLLSACPAPLPPTRSTSPKQKRKYSLSFLHAAFQHLYPFHICTLSFRSPFPFSTSRIHRHSHRALTAGGTGAPARGLTPGYQNTFSLCQLLLLPANLFFGSRRLSLSAYFFLLSRKAVSASPESRYSHLFPLPTIALEIRDLLLIRLEIPAKEVVLGSSTTYDRVLRLHYHIRQL